MSAELNDLAASLCFAVCTESQAVRFTHAASHGPDIPHSLGASIYTKRGSAWCIVREVRSVKEREREREREREWERERERDRQTDRRKWRHYCRAEIDHLHIAWVRARESGDGRSWSVTCIWFQCFRRAESCFSCLRFVQVTDQVTDRHRMPRL